MQERHKDRGRYFKEQSYTTEKHVIPYLQTQGRIDANTSILEIGCGEGGNLEPFVEMGCTVTGIDINCRQIENAKKYLGAADNPKLQLICKDIYLIDPAVLGSFDVIIMRDVIEHIPHQEKFMAFVKQFMHKGTLFFLGFPPWQMPFGGHQQGLNSKILSKLPYFHLLPKPIYKWILKTAGEPDVKIRSLMEHVDTGISVERFKSIIKKENYTVLDETPYLFNPNYDVKFNLPPKKQIDIINKIPYLRNYLSTCYYYILTY